MANLPSGTVTFLFTDIEGPTRLLQQLLVDGKLTISRAASLTCAVPWPACVGK
jgi:hypothetical protein